MSIWTLFILVGFSVVLGGLCDFVVGPCGQKALIDKMETKWIDFYDADWSNIANREAKLFLALFSKYVGDQLLSKQRLWISVLLLLLTTTVSALICLSLHPALYGHVSANDWVQIAIYLCLNFAVLIFSIAVSHKLTTLSIPLMGRGALRNLIFLALGVLIYYLLVEILTGFTLAVHFALEYVIAVFLSHGINQVSVYFINAHISQILSFIRLYRGDDVIGFPPLFAWSILESPVFTSQWHGTLVAAISGLNDLFVSAIVVSARFIFLVTFIGLFSLQAFIIGPVSLGWRRLVEKGTAPFATVLPILTLVICGIAVLWSYTSPLGFLFQTITPRLTWPVVTTSAEIRFAVNGVFLSEFPEGAPINAAADGTVIEVAHAEHRYEPPLFLITIKHADHLSTHYWGWGKISVVEGQAVRRGEVIALASVPLLYFEMTHRLRVIDPRLYMPSFNGKRGPDGSVLDMWEMELFDWVNYGV